VHVPQAGDHKLAGGVDDGRTFRCRDAGSDAIDEAAAEDDGDVGDRGASGGINDGYMFKD
jgi:hypothetical protein